MNFGIIAAGEGSRLAQEGVALPKPLVRLNGQPMIGRLIDIFINAGAERICIITNEHMADVADFVRRLSPSLPVPVELVVKTTPSSMHSFYEIGTRLAPYGRFIVTTVDTIFREDDFARYVDAYRDAPEDTDGMMAVTDFIDDEKPLYVETAPDETITAFLDAPAPGIKYISAGIYGLGPKAVGVLDSCLEKGVQRMRNYQRALVDAGLLLRAFPLGKVIDVDHAADIPKAEALLD